MSITYKLYTFYWYGIYGETYATDSYNNRSGLSDTNQIYGGQSGIIHYTKSGGSSPYRWVTHHWVLYFTDAPTANTPPRACSFRSDTQAAISAYTAGTTSVTINGITYLVYDFDHLTYHPDTNKWDVGSESGSDVVIDSLGTTAKNTVHDLGDKTDSTDQQIYLEGLTYLLGEAPSGHGQGTTTLTLKPPAQKLTFTSLLLGKSITKWIASGATEVNFQDPEPPEPPTIIQDTKTATINGSPSWSQITSFELIQQAVARIVCMRYSAPNQTNKSLSVQGASGGSCRHFSSYGMFASVIGIIAENNVDETVSYYVDAGGNYFDNASLTVNYTCVAIPNTTRVNVSQASTTTTSLAKKIETVLAAGKYIVTSRYSVSNGRGSAYNCLKIGNDVLCGISNNGSQSSAWPYAYCCAIVECSSETTIESWGQYSSSDKQDATNLYIVKLSGTIAQNIFSESSSTTLTSVCELSLPKGEYLIVSQLDFTYSNSDVEYYQKVSYGNETVIEESGLSYSSQPVASNSMQYVSLSSRSTLTMQVKTSTSGISISGYIKAIKIA